MCSWDLENALNKYAPFPSPKRCYIPAKPTKPLSTEVTQERLQQSYQIAASAVKEYGDIYLKIFERLHYEIDNFETNKSLLNTAFKVANDKQNN